MTDCFLVAGAIIAFAVVASNSIVFGAPWRFPTDKNLERKLRPERRPPVILPGRRVA